MYYATMNQQLMFTVTPRDRSNTWRPASCIAGAHATCRQQCHLFLDSAFRSMKLLHNLLCYKYIYVCIYKYVAIWNRFRIYSYRLVCIPTIPTIMFQYKKIFPLDLPRTLRPSKHFPIPPILSEPTYFELID